MLQLTKMQTQGHTTDPSSLLNIATIQSLTCPPYRTGLDDETIHTNTLLIDPNIPYLHIITLPTHSQTTYGLTLLVSIQVRWSASIPHDMIPPILKDTRKKLLLQPPMITRRHVDTPRPARDSCTIYIPAFHVKSSTDCYRFFRTTTLHTLCRHLTRYKHRY